MILITIRAVIASMCPFTSKLGSVLSIFNIVAFYVFIIMVFFVAPHWWHGLIALAINFIIPLFTPRVDPNSFSNTARFVSLVLSSYYFTITNSRYVFRPIYLMEGRGMK